MYGPTWAGWERAGGDISPGTVKGLLPKNFTDKALKVLQYGSGLLRPLEETIDRGKHFIAEKTADAESTVKAGREIMKDRLKGVVAEPMRTSH